MTKNNFLFVFHTPQNEGYAIGTLERTFFEAASLITSEENVYFSFTKLTTDRTLSLPENFKNNIQIDINRLKNKNYFSSVVENLKTLEIDIAMCFDMQPDSNLKKALRAASIGKVISYCGAMISDYNSGLKLLAKKIQVRLIADRPDLYIFESKAMQDLAIRGRGIPEKETIVIHTGVDTTVWGPKASTKQYVEKCFPETKGRFIALYSGHMEPRKGVDVIIKAANYLHDINKLDDVHFLLFGNRDGEADRLINLIETEETKNHITFGGYCSDLNLIMPGCDIGVIASVGWDSFPMSSLEMAASGLPVIASDLQGLTETIENNVTGKLFKPGEHRELAMNISTLIENKQLRETFSLNGRSRIMKELSKDIQIQRLKDTFSKVLSS